MSKFRLLLSLCFCLGATHLHAQLRITEVMSSSGNNSQDWFELTNYGNVTITLDSNWRVDDSSNSFVASLPLDSGSTLAVTPGQSVVFIEGGTNTIDAFKTLWGLTDVEVGNYSGSGIGFSSGGDAVNLFHTGTNHTSVLFGSATEGSSFFWTYSDDENTSISGGPSLSVLGENGAYQAGSDTGSPGLALPLTSPTTLQWIGGPGTWSAMGGTNWQAGPWDPAKTAVFAVGSGSVTLSEDVAALGLDFRTDGYEISGPGSVETGQVSVVHLGDTAVLDIVLTGTQGLTKFGLGTLILGAQNTYEGATSVSQGVVRITTDDAIPDASLLSVARFAAFEMNGHSDIVAGISGLGTIDMGAGNLTVSITGSDNVELNGFLRGSGDFIVDSSGSGDQVFNTTGQSLLDGAVKDYTGATIIRNGTLRVNETAIPIATSQVLLEGGKVRLTTDGASYTFGGDSSVEVVLAGGAIRQDDGESVTLENSVHVTADSAVEAHLDAEDPFSAPVVTLAGSVSGTGGLAVTSGGRVDIATGGTYSGTISVAASQLSINGTLNSGSVILDADSTLSGSGSVGSVSGAGKISPGSSPGIQTFGSVDPTGGLDFAFEFTAAAPNYADALFSDNDVLRITGANPLEPGLAGGNTVEIFLSFATLTEGDFFLGGFFLDQHASFDSLVAGADYLFYVTGDGGGTDAFVDGFGYYALGNYDPALGIAVSSVAAAVDFGGGTINGGIMQLTVVPEPTSLALSVCGLLFLSQAMRRRSSRQNLSS